MSAFATAWNALHVLEGVRQLVFLLTIVWVIIIVVVSLPMAIVNFIRRL